jgi:hypothetical protein
VEKWRSGGEVGEGVRVFRRDEIVGRRLRFDQCGKV